MYQKQINLFATLYLLYCLPLTKFESNFSDLSVIISIYIIQTYGATESLRSVLGQNHEYGVRYYCSRPLRSFVVTRGG